MSDPTPQMDQMEDGKMNGRAILVVVIIGLAFLVSGFSVFYITKSNHERSADVERLVHDLLKERDERVDQDCVIFEGNQAGDVDTLKRTYGYLNELSPSQLQEPLNRVILSGLTRTEAEAKLDDAPDYCDAPGVGLKEPDPKMPIRPRALSDLLADD